MEPDRLIAIRLFALLHGDDRRVLAAVAREAGADPGAVLMRQGEVAHELIAIEQGRVAVQRDGVQVAELETGDVVGELGVLLRRRRSATVVALTPLRLITLTAWDLRRLGRRAPSVLEHLGAIVRERQRASSTSGDPANPARSGDS